MTGRRIILQKEQVLQEISLANATLQVLTADQYILHVMAVHGSTEARFDVKQQVTKVVGSNSTKSIRNYSQTFSVQRKKLHIT